MDGSSSMTRMRGIRVSQRWIRRPGCRFNTVYRKDQRKGASLPGCAGDRNAPAMGREHVLDDGQAEPRAGNVLLLRAFRTVEFFEDPAVFRRRDATAAVDDADAGLAV